MFETKEVHRWDGPSEPDEHSWTSVLIESTSPVYLARLVTSDEDAPHEVLLATPTSVWNALVSRSHGEVAHLFRMVRPHPQSGEGWTCERVVKAHAYRLALHGGMDALAVDVESGERHWVHPVAASFRLNRGMAVWDPKETEMPSCQEDDACA